MSKDAGKDETEKHHLNFRGSKKTMPTDTKEALEKLDKDGLLRSPKLITQGKDLFQSRHVLVDDTEALLLCSNDYLGLSTHPAMKKAAIIAAEQYGTGAGASRLVSGTMGPHTELEDAIKNFTQAEAALLFNSGWHANTGVIPALATKTTEIFTDKLDHASIIDGSLISRAKIIRYPHANTYKLEELLKKSSARTRLIVTDGLFSMDGDLAPIRELVALSEKYNVRLIIDDSHGIGTLGAEGRGSIEELGLSIKDLTSAGTIVIGTFGKAFGSYGAFALSDKNTIKFITNKARSFIYSTALPPAVCMASITALELIKAEPERIIRLRENSAYMRDILQGYGLSIIANDQDDHKTASMIIPVVIGTAQEATEAAKKLMDNGIFIQAIRPPTVAEGTARLRITVSSEHTQDELTRAAVLIREAACGKGI